MRDMTITPVFTPNAPAAGGHYAQAIKHAGLVYVSGQLPVAPDGSHHPEADFDDTGAAGDPQPDLGGRGRRCIG